MTSVSRRSATTGDDARQASWASLRTVPEAAVEVMATVTLVSEVLGTTAASLTELHPQLT